MKDSPSAAPSEGAAAQPTASPSPSPLRWPQRLAIAASALILLLAGAVALIFLAIRLAPTLKHLITHRPPRNRT